MQVVHRVTNPGQQGAKFLINCPGCGCAHGWNDTWKFNNDLVAPTVQPSLLVTHLDHPGHEDCSGICHSYITDGKIQFLSDCTHHLAGQTIQLQPCLKTLLRKFSHAGLNTN